MNAYKLSSRAALAVMLCYCSAVALAMPTVPMHFTQLSIQDGLSQHNVQSILQDSKGYMWFATESGLNRYDGYEIHRYSRERGNPQGFANDFVWLIAEDAAQDLWLATQGGGVVRWNRTDDSFTAFRHDPANPNSLASDDVRTLLVNADGTIWVGTRGKGLDLLDPQTGLVEHFRHDPEDPRSLSNDMVYALHADSMGQLWVGTDGGVNRLHAATRSFQRLQHDKQDARSLSDNKVRAIFTDQAGTLWIGTSNGGLNRLDQTTRTFESFRHDPADPASLSNDHVRVIFEDDAGRLWIGTADGLNLFDRTVGTAVRYQNVPGEPNSLHDSYIDALYQDRSGLLWIGTRSAGVSSWNPRSWSLGHYNQAWLNDANVTSFASAGNGQVWVGTLGGGLTRIDERTYAIEHYRHVVGDPATISDDRVMSLLLDRDGDLWVGTMKGGLNRINTATREIRFYRHEDGNAQSLAADGVMSLYEDRDGRLWIGTYGGGVSVFNKDTGTFVHYAHDPDDPTSLSDSRASAIVQDKNGSMWIGTFGGGLNLLDDETGSFRRFINDPYDATSPADNKIYSLHLDGAGNLWAGTAGGGLDQVVEPSLKDDNYHFRNVSQQDGLPSDVIYGVQSDASGRIWLSTNNGLTRFDPESGGMKNFHRGHGLQGEEYNYGASHRAANGKLYFGGANGFNAFHPQQVLESAYAPEIVLTAFQKFNEPVGTNVPYDRLARIDLGYKDDVVNFSFAALEFTEAAQNTYAYMLEGFDRNWIDSGTMRHITYTNLDAGRYVLKVRATTSDGVASSSEFSLPVVVAAAPWETRTAYLFYAIGALTLLWLIWRMQQRKFQREAEYSRRLENDVELRTRQLEERNLELQVATRAKSDFLARMSHEIRTPMNGMMGMTQLLLGTKLNDKQNRFAQTIHRSAESLLEIINDILDFSKIEAGRLELERVEFNVNELVDETVELFSSVACDKGVELMCSAPPGKTVAAVGDPQRLKQILVNLLGNAIKFTQDGEVVLRYMLVADEGGEVSLRFEVTDTGVGIQPENLSIIFRSFSQEDGSTSRRFGGTGLGLAICKQLVEMMGGEIGLESEPKQGSKFWFTVTLPKAGPAWLSRQVSFRLANLNVLVVDNNTTNSDIVAGYLTALGVNAVSVTSGYAGLKRLDKGVDGSPFDLVLLDEDVGDMTGLALGQAIRKNAKTRSAKLILLSPAAAPMAEDEWRAAGIDESLAKPIRQSMLYECLLALTASTGAFRGRIEDRDTDFPNQEPLEGSVLLVEDNPVNQAVALGMLEELGCDTVVAINGRDAIEYIAKQQFDVVLMDCEMPVMDGYETTAAIREQSGSASYVPIIALTANAVDGDRERCLASGMQDYLSKPISVERLHGTLRKWLPADDNGSGANEPGSIDHSSLESIRNLKGVGGDTMVTRVVELYLSNSSLLLEDLRTALLERDAEAVRQSAHALKSSSQNVGAFGLATLSQELEEMGRNGEIDDVQKYLADLDDLYPKTVSALKAAVG